MTKQTKSGSGFNDRKPNGTIHFVSAEKSLEATFNLFGPLVFDGEASFLERLNKDSWQTSKAILNMHLAKHCLQRLSN